VKTKWKILLAILVLALIAGGVFASVQYQKRGVVTVQTGRVLSEDLASVVTASGEIKPKNYINIGANQQGELTSILVKEGDHVQKGQLLAEVENTQSTADVQAQKAMLSSAEADSAASEAAVKAADDNIASLEASVGRTKADLDKAMVEFRRGEQLYGAKLIAKQDYDQRKAAVDAAKAAVDEADAHVVQARTQRAQAFAQAASAQKRVAQAQAALARFDDVLKQHNSYAPIAGIVTNLPVRQGETVVPGVQNSAASTIMTIADMSLITAEVKVDETDIVNVKLDQPAEVTIDAMPNKIFKGHVTEIGNTAIVRSTGVAASQSTTSSQEAKDFKVVIVIDNPPDDIRPGLSCTGKVTTATRSNVMAIPIQALTVRERGDLEKKEKEKASSDSHAAENPDPVKEKAMKEEIQGVFVITPDGKALFQKVETGITGATDIEVTSGLKAGQEIVTGTYQVIRTLRNDTRIKIDNKKPDAALAKT
jgi:HlyD family secretion protein